MNNHGNKLAQKENENSAETKLKNMEKCDLNDRELKIVVLKKLNDTEENSEKQFNELWNKTNEQKKYFTRDWNYKMNQT